MIHKALAQQINFQFFIIYGYSSIDDGIISMPFNSQFEKMNNQTVYPFEIISLAIKHITILYLLIIYTFRYFLIPIEVYHSSNFRRCFVCLFVCFVALRPKSTAMVMTGRSVHLTTFLTWASLNKRFKPVLRAHTFACN